MLSASKRGSSFKALAADLGSLDRGRHKPHLVADLHNYDGGQQRLAASEVSLGGGMGQGWWLEAGE